MTLKKIDERLSLFNEYLTYRIDFIAEHECFKHDFYRAYELFGVLYYRTAEERLLTYNEWLFYNKHEDLII